MFEPLSPITRRDARVALQECISCATRLSSPMVMCHQIISILNHHLGYERGAIVLRRAKDGPLVLVAHCPGQQDEAEHQREIARVEQILNNTEPGVIATVIDRGEPINLSDVRQTGEYLEGAGHIRSELCVPLITAGVTVGAFNVETDQPEFFGEDDLMVMSIVAAILAPPLARLPVDIIL